MNSLFSQEVLSKARSIIGELPPGKGITLVEFYLKLGVSNHEFEWMVPALELLIAEATHGHYKILPGTRTIAPVSIFRNG